MCVYIYIYIQCIHIYLHIYLCGLSDFLFCVCNEAAIAAVLEDLSLEVVMARHGSRQLFIDYCRTKFACKAAQREKDWHVYMYVARMYIYIYIYMIMYIYVCVNMYLYLYIYNM